MTTTPTLDQAIETLRKLPEDRQAEWAEQITATEEKRQTDERYYDTRTMQGLEEAMRGEGTPAENVLAQLKAENAARRS